MQMVFRADASLKIGTGHVMRCLTLANTLRDRGAMCTFMCREQPGHLIGYIRRQGYRVEVLPIGSCTDCDTGVPLAGLAHAAWLGVTQQQDVDACVPILQRLRPDWLIVDHYALDSNWEAALQGVYERLMVIDDLADRNHECDLLLDQNLGRAQVDYQSLVPDSCQRLIGARYAMLRPEFARLRSYSLARRKVPELRRLLITMGGGDTRNVTGEVLEALKHSALPAACRITVVMGAQALYLQSIQSQADGLSWETEVCVDVDDMAQRMADSDLCIGAAGGTSWERCCMGLPAILTVLADNQQLGAQALQRVGAAVYVRMDDIPYTLSTLVSEISQAQRLSTMSEQARTVADGQGVDRVASVLLGDRGAR